MAALDATILVDRFVAPHRGHAEVGAADSALAATIGLRPVDFISKLVERC